MTVSANNSRLSYNGDSVTVSFTTPYFLSNSDIKFYVGGVLKAFTTDYSLTGAGNASGGTLTAVVAPAAGVKVVVLRDPDQLQATQLPPNDPFPSKSVETSMDKLTMLLQRTRDLLSRSICFPDSDTSGANMNVPAPSPGKVMKWDASGLNLINSTYDPDTQQAASSASAAAALSSQNASASSASAASSSQSSAATSATNAGNSATAAAASAAAAAANVPVAIHAASSKATPVDADEAGIWDSVSGLLNKVTWANIKATLKTYFDTLYTALVAPGASGNILTSNGAAWTSAAPTGGTSKIQPITCTQASGALTLGTNATTLDFRSTTLTTGVPNTRAVPALSMVIPSGATLGAVTTVAARLIAIVIDNAGTPEQAVINIAGGNDLSETGLISTTAVSAGATSANVFYSTTARTNVPYRVVGAVDAVNTAGAWGNPTLVQGMGGQALAAMSSLGYGQNLQIVTRTSGTTYYNTTGKPKALFQQVNSSSGGNYSATISINGGSAIQFGSIPLSSLQMTATVIIPSYASYLITDTNLLSKTVYELG